MSSIKKLSRALRILDKKTKVLLVVASIFRIGLNVLDFIALAVVGIVAYLAANADKSFILDVPVLGLSSSFTILDVPWLAVIAAFLFLLKSVTAILFSFNFGHRVSQLETQYSRQWIFDNFEFTKRFDAYPDSPTVHTTLMRSMNSLVTGILTSLVTMASEGALLVFLIAGFVVLNPVAALLVVVYLGSIVAIMSFFILPSIQSESAKDYAASHKMLEITRDYLANRKAIVAHGRNEIWLNDLAKTKGMQIESANRGLSLTSLPRNLIETALILGVFGFLGVVVVFSDIPSQAVTIGIFLVGGLRLVSAILPLQASVGVLRQSLMTIDHALDGLVNDMRPSTKSNAGPTDFDLTVEDLTFESVDSGFQLEKLSLKIPFGSKFAIVGPSGAGKTTLGELLLGLRHPEKGSVLVGGIPSSDLIDRQSPHLAYVPQQPQLISGSLAQNVSLNGEPDFERAQKVLLESGLSDLLKRSPDGLSTFISPGDQPLSGGEMQRLGLARALYMEAKIILLDEATSALDAATEEFISSTLRRFRGNKTLIVIAHRLSTIVDSDKILYLDRGKVKGFGTYDELLSSVPDFLKAVHLLSSEPRASK